VREYRDWYIEEDWESFKVRSSYVLVPFKGTDTITIMAFRMKSLDSKLEGTLKDTLTFAFVIT